MVVASANWDILWLIEPMLMPLTSPRGQVILELGESRLLRPLKGERGEKAALWDAAVNLELGAPEAFNLNRAWRRVYFIGEQ
jgi:hypothetical protein